MQGRRRERCHGLRGAGTRPGARCRGCAVLAMALSTAEGRKEAVPVPRTRWGAGAAGLAMEISSPGKQPCCRSQHTGTQARVGNRSRSSTAKTEGSLRYRGRDRDRGWGQPAAGQSGRLERTGLAWLTPRCPERLPSCIPSSHFRSFQPFLSSEVSHLSALCSSPGPPHTLLCPASRSIAAHAARPCCRAPGMGMALPSWCRCPCPLCSHPCMLQQRGQRREAELPLLLQTPVLLSSSEVLPLVQKLQD